MKRPFINLTAAMLLSTAILGHADSGTALKADTLRTEPFADAKSTGAIQRGDKLEILDKKGAWLNVKTVKSTGWVRLLSVKRGDIAKANGANDAAGVLSVASGRAGTGQVVSTTGVRGLSEEELKSAKFNAEEIKKLESTGISKEQAQQFAAIGNLQARKLDYLPEPSGNQGGAQ
jgi:uncharacterized protein YgiM (DUF1202 family)